MLRNLVIAISLVFLCALTAFAEPPQEIVQHITQHKLVHNGLCDFHSEKNVRCLIFYDEPQDIVYLVLLYETKKGFQTSRIYGVKDDVETLLWQNPDLTV